MGHFNRTGKHWNSHYDDWTKDEIVELAAEAGVKPSFPTPEILATRIVTEETFGIIAVPNSLVIKYKLQPVTHTNAAKMPMAGDTPVHLLTRLSTRPISPYKFLAEQQRLANALLPIHTAEEYNLFKRLLTSENYFNPVSKMPTPGHTARTVNFEKLTQ